MLKWVLLLVLVVLVTVLYTRSRQTKLYGYDDLKTFKNITYTPGGIPRLIFKTSHYKMSDIPREMMNALARTQGVNPTYSIFYFDDDDVSRCMEDFSPEVHELYKKLIPGAFKADFFRVCILYVYGGCYSDIGHVSLEPFDTICEDANLVLVNDCLDDCKNAKYYIGIHNALMCTTPKQPYFKMSIDAISSQIREETYGENWFDITGPTILGKVFNCYFHGVCDNVNKKLLKPGITTYGTCKVKILSLYVPSFEEGYIKDNGKQVILTKFDNYHSVMYASKNITRYNELWEQRRVYK